MGFSRRELVKAGAAFSTWTLLSEAGPATAFALPQETPPPAPTTRFTRSAFKKQLNRAFRVQGGGIDTQLKLVAVQDPLCAAQAGTVGSEVCFSLVFRGPLSVPLQQATYKARNTAFGAFQLFLVPVGQPTTYAWYEAAFNQI